MNILKDIARWIPGIQSIARFTRSSQSTFKLHSNPFVKTFPPGHFYSTLPDLDEVLSKKEALFQHKSKDCLGVDLAEDVQLEMLDKLAIYYGDLSFPDLQTASHRYYYQNIYFCYSDAIILYSMIRHFQPARIIEIGSGFSSAVMLDTNDAFLERKMHLTFIEPHPERLFELLSEADKVNCEIIVKSVKDVELKVFESLNAGDILFIDSSHVVKIGSDVAYLFFEVLPRLNPGVIVHIHDIFWGFEYPIEWLQQGMAWNEAYFLRCFMQYNPMFQVLYFNSYMGEFHQDKLDKKMPLCLKNTGGSFWIQKML